MTRTLGSLLLLGALLTSCTDNDELLLPQPHILTLDIRHDRIWRESRIDTVSSVSADFYHFERGVQVSAGRVWIGATEIPGHPTGYSLSGPPSALPLPVEGNTPALRAEGSGDFPAFSVPLAAMPGLPRITSLKPGDTVSLASELVIDWTPSRPSDEGAYAGYMIVDAAGDLDAGDGGQDDGRLVISAETMKAFAPGSMTIVLQRRKGSIVRINERYGFVNVTSAEAIPVFAVE